MISADERRRAEGVRRRRELLAGTDTLLREAEVALPANDEPSMTWLRDLLDGAIDSDDNDTAMRWVPNEVLEVSGKEEGLLDHWAGYHEDRNPWDDSVEGSEHGGYVDLDRSEAAVELPAPRRPSWMVLDDEPASLLRSWSLDQLRDQPTFTTNFETTFTLNFESLNEQQVAMIFGVDPSLTQGPRVTTLVLSREEWLRLSTCHQEQDEITIESDLTAVRSTVGNQWVTLFGHAVRELRLVSAPVMVEVDLELPPDVFARWQVDGPPAGRLVP